MRRHWKKFALGLLLVVVAAGFVGYGIIEPRTPIGHAVFHTAYAFPPTRPLYLRFLTWSLREFEGGYLPPDGHEFLVDRLWECKGTPEWRAIIDFYVRQTSARWSDPLFRPYTDDLHGQIVAYLIENLDKYSPEDCASAMVLIESLRRDKELAKCDINIHNWDEQNRKYIWPPEKREQATQLFRRWWGDGHQWPNNKSQNPLEGSPFEIYSWGG